MTVSQDKTVGPVASQAPRFDTNELDHCMNSIGLGTTTLVLELELLLELGLEPKKAKTTKELKEKLDSKLESQEAFELFCVENEKKKPPYIGTWEDILGIEKFNVKNISNFKSDDCYQINQAITSLYSISFKTFQFLTEEEKKFRKRCMTGGCYQINQALTSLYSISLKTFQF